MPEIKVKILPSVEKCFLDEKIETKPELTEISMLRNERLSFQFAYTYDDLSAAPKQYCSLFVDSLLTDCIKIEKIEPVPVAMPAYPQSHDDNYLRTEPGLFPDLLVPIDIKLPLVAVHRQLRSLLFTIENIQGIEPGEYEIEIGLIFRDNKYSQRLNIKVVDAFLPEQELIHTQWFHNDCLATYYGCDVFSERHWEIIGNFMEGAVRCGVNMLLTPVLTPPIDTAVGHERPTVQLVDISLKNGKYEFVYDKLDRYVKLALEKGIKYFEISHFFTQWGAAHAPKVMADVDGEYKRIFGWETDSTSEEYKNFIRAFVSGLLEHLKLLGIDKQCRFHVSDEPHLNQLESYKKAKSLIADLLEGYQITDALSSYEFYSTGACPSPIPASNHIEPFIENNVPNLWTYYCCSQNKNVSNRFLAMPGERTRILGEQLYKFNIRGFLQWGFNFWYSQYSLHPINPFAETCGEYFVPAGDAFSVYPGQDGKPLYSLHAVHFYEALQDMRALKLLEKKIGREKVIEIIEEGCTEPLTFSKYPHSQEYLLRLRERVNSLL
jgi:hypothetical protein